MASARIVEPVDVFEDGDFGITTRSPGSLPQQLSLDRLEERLDCRVIIAIAFAAHRHLEAMLAQDFLIVVGAILTAAICVVDAAFWRSAQSYGHVQRPDRQVALHPIADGPADDAPRMQIEDDSQIQPAFPGPGIADVTGPFLVSAISSEVPVQQVRRDIETVIAVGRGLELLVSLHLNAILLHQATNAAMPDIKTEFLQFFRHSGPSVAAQR